MADILLLTSDFPPYKGGIAADSFNLFELLRTRHNVKVHVFGVAGKNSKEIEYHRGSKALYPYLLNRVLKMGRYDAVLVRTVLPLGWMLNLLNYKGKLVYFIYGQECIASKGIKPRPSVRKIISHADIVVANSVFTAGLSGRECSVYYPLIADESAEFTNDSDKKSKKDAFVIGSAGRLVEHKNFVSVIRILRRLDSATFTKTGMHVEYHITGRGPEEARWREEAEKEGVDGIVRFLGEKNAVEMDAFYRSIDLLAVPSIRTERSVEGFGMVVQEAAVRNVPSAGFRSGGLAESIGDDDMLADEGDADALFAIMAKTFADENFRKKKAEAAHKNSEKFLMSEERLKEFEYILGI